MFWTILSSESLWASYSVIPSLRLRTASEHFFCHSERSTSGVKNLILFRVSDSEESPQETLRLRLRVTKKRSSWAIAKDLHLFHQTGFSIRKFLRFPFADPSHRRLRALAQDIASGQGTPKSHWLFGDPVLNLSEWQDERKTSFF